MTSAPPCLAAGTRLGPFEIARPIGHGGAATVYLAHERGSAAEAALKVLAATGRRQSACREHLTHEALMLGVLRGPHVPEVLGVSTTDASPWLAMSLAGEQSLAARLRAEGPCSPAQARGILLGVAGALQAVHEMGVLHMDLTPSNVMLSKGGVRLIDFGAARAVRHPFDTPSSADEGTPGYVAPERCGGASPNARMDVFSLGAVAYRVLLGIRPYVDPRSLRAGRCARSKRLAPPDRLRHDITPELGELLLRTLSLAPGDRPESPRAFAEALTAAIPAQR